jgi:hypothetical protein
MDPRSLVPVCNAGGGRYEIRGKRPRLPFGRSLIFFSILWVGVDDGSFKREVAVMPFRQRRSHVVG